MQIHLLHSEVESSYSRTPCKEDRSLLYLCNSGVNVEFMRPKVWIAGPIQLLDPPRLVWSVGLVSKVKFCRSFDVGHQR